jgi:Cu-processing system permease protein
MNATHGCLAAIAVREVREAIRNRWVLAASASLGGLALMLALLGSAAVGESRAAPLAVAVANLSSLSVYLVPLLALLVSFDAIVGESERGTLALLLTYPVKRWQLLVGKFAGHLTVLTFAVALGYGPIGGFVIWRSADPQGWQGYVAMMLASVLLGAVFVALGYLVSVICRQRASAVGAVIVLWLALVVLYDLGLLGVLLADENHAIGERVFAALLLINPGDAYRLFNLLAIDAVSALTGMSAVVDGLALERSTPLLVLAAWVVAPLAMSAILFQRREI